MLHGSTFAFALRIVISRGTSPSLCLPLTPPLFPSHSDASAIGIFSPTRRSSDDGEKGKDNKQRGREREPPGTTTVGCDVPTSILSHAYTMHRTIEELSYKLSLIQQRSRSDDVPCASLPTWSHRAVDHDRSSVPLLTRTTTAGGKTITWKRKKTRIAV